MSGIFAIVSKQNCSKKLFYGIDYNSHRGTNYGGMAVLSSHGIKREIKTIDQNQFKSKFRKIYSEFVGTSGIGAISGAEHQPIKISSTFGDFAICTDGVINNKEELADGLKRKTITFSENENGETNTSELVAKLICGGKTISEGIRRMYSVIDGSISLAMLTKEGIYVAGDRFPLVLGRGKDSWAISSESCAFPNLEFELIRDISRREIVLMNTNEIKVLSEPNPNGKVCSFLWIYTGSPASYYDNINAEAVREKCGARLAQRDKESGIKIDLVAGVPDSGIAHAIGYTNEGGIPYGQPLLKYTAGYGRSYTPDNQSERDEVASNKLIPNKDAIKNKKIVILEDSIVRGTQLKNKTINKLQEGDVSEIHVRPACPPLMWPCRFNVSTRNIDELIARKAIKALEGKNIEDINEYLDPNSKKYSEMNEWIRNHIGIDTLIYQTLEDMIEAIGLPKEKLCTHCWDGSN